MADGVALGKVTIKVRPGVLCVITQKSPATAESTTQEAVEKLPVPPAKAGKKLPVQVFPIVETVHDEEKAISLG